MLSAPVGIGAIDAGSNAIRALIARAVSPGKTKVLTSERIPIRLGHPVFAAGRLDRLTLEQTVQAFRHFRNLLRGYNVQEYRAVATSAVREARNRDALLQRIFRESGLRLEVIDAAEEARLVRSAVCGALREKASPRLVVDLGGGSLEISLLREEELESSFALPIGTVRLLETFGAGGALTEDQADRLSHHVISMLRTVWPDAQRFSRAVAVACGGNAEVLARLAPGPPFAGVNTLNLRLLRERLWEILRLDVPGRMKAFRVRRDRADVMGIAAIVFTALGDWLRLNTFLVPAVGVREGILRDLAAEHFAAPFARNERAQALLEHARQFAARLHCEPAHAEHVRYLAASLFDQLATVHALPADLRLPLEMAALVHDAGLVINTKSHHKHGEYLVRNAQIPGLAEDQQALVACLVRYHAKATPQPHHKLYSSLAPRDRRRVRALAALLRVAVALDAGTRMAQQVKVRTGRKEILVRVHAGPGSRVNLWAARRRADLFEREFGVKVVFSRARHVASDAANKSATDALDTSRPAEIRRSSAA